jgi:hypothetical protein
MLAVQAQTAPSSQVQSGLIDMGSGWATHSGDDPAWAAPGFDSSSWETVDFDDIGSAQSGWHWFRKEVHLGSGFVDVALLLEGGDGTYEIYVNGARLPGANLQSAFNVYRPTERAFPLHDVNGDFTISLRTRAPANYVDYKLPLFLSGRLGAPSDIEFAREALQAARLDGVWPSIAINLLLCIAGIAVLCLYFGQRAHRDYLYLGFYLFVLGLSNGLWNLQQSGVAPTALNILVSDPLIYLYSILQIEFTFSFVGKRPSKALRIYQASLLLPWILAGLCWTNRLPVDTYALIEAAITIPVAIILTTLLLVWYRRGNREAGWLIFPSLLPLLAGGLFDLGTTSIVLGWQKFDFLDSPLPVGLLRFQVPDLANLLFLIAILVVLFFRFARVSREQARTAAELGAAREIQQRLVPAVLPAVAGFRIAAAYLPAQEVGGDFYQILQLGNGAALLVVGDVSGKGLKAAMTGALAIGALRTLAAEDIGPAELLTRLNRQIHSAENGGFVTCLALRVASGGAVSLANAGHLPPYFNRKEVPLDSALPLGIVADSQFSETTLHLAPGEMLTLLTDGVVEARTAAGELFGFDRAAAISTQSAEAIARAAQQFGQEDDITVLTLTRLPASPEIDPVTALPALAPTLVKS